MRTSRHRPPASALRDERGAMMILGIFMSTCLVGILWYLACVGDAILYRERMQEAADAAAFSDAALEARGMNLLVMMNLVMACILGVRVALKVASFVCKIAVPIFKAIGAAVPVFLAAVPPIEAAVQVLDDAVEATREPIDRALQGLSRAQQAVARAAPEVARVGALAAAAKYQRGVATVRLAHMSDASDGLPVEAGSPSKLCEEAGRSVGHMSAWLFDKGGLGVLPSGPIEWLGERIGEFASVAPGSFCELPGASSPNTNDAYGVAISGGDNPGSMTTAPQRTVASFANGNVRGQVVAGAVGSDGTLAHSTRLVRIALAGQLDQIPPTRAATEPSVAQAEFFFDCAGSWAECNRDEDAMWHLKWRPRLRRYNEPRPLPVLLATMGLRGEPIAPTMIAATILRAVASSPVADPALAAELSRAVTEPTMRGHGAH